MGKSLFPAVCFCKVYDTRMLQRFYLHTLFFQTKTIFVLFSLFLIFLYNSTAEAKSKEIIGRIEKVRIFPGNFFLKTKIDTGAKTCSINAPNYKLFDRDGEKWVKFDLVNDKEEKLSIEERVIRTATLKRVGMPSEKRPVIKLGICMGDIYKEVEVNLSNRTDLLYQMLIGRNFLLDDFLIDVSLNYFTEPKCESVSADE